jgi:hypothetical protein
MIFSFGLPQHDDTSLVICKEMFVFAYARKTKTFGIFLYGVSVRHSFPCSNFAARSSVRQILCLNLPLQPAPSCTIRDSSPTCNILLRNWPWPFPVLNIKTLYERSVSVTQHKQYCSSCCLLLINTASHSRQPYRPYSASWELSRSQYLLQFHSSLLLLLT